MEKAERDARIEKRKERFGEVKPIEKTFQNRVKIVKWYSVVYAAKVI